MDIQLSSRVNDPLSPAPMTITHVAARAIVVCSVAVVIMRMADRRFS